MGLIFSKSLYKESMGMLPSLSSRKIEDRKKAASFFRNIFLNKQKADMKHFVQKTSLVKDLVSCLKEEEHPQLQIDASSALINLVLAFDNESVTDIVLSSGAIHILCTIADQESNLKLRDEVLFDVSCLTCNENILYGGDRDGEKCRQSLLESRYLDVLLLSLQYNIQKEKESDTAEGDSQKEVIDAKEFYTGKSEEQGSLTEEAECDESITMALNSLRIMCNGPPEIPVEQMRGFAPCLLYIIKKHGNTLENWLEPEFVSDAFEVLENLAHGTPLEVAQLVQDNGDLCSSLVSLLYEPNATLVDVVLEILNGINDAEPQAVLDAGILSAFRHILRETAMPLQRKMVWDKLDDFTQKQSYIQAVLYNEEFAVVIIESVENGDKQTLRRAVKVIRNLATRGTNEQTRRLVKLGIFEALCSSWHQIKSDMDYEETGVQSNILWAIEACLVRADKPSRRVYCNVLDFFGIRELLDHAASSAELTQRAQQLKDDFFSHPPVVETEGDNFVEFHFFPRNRKH